MFPTQKKIYRHTIIRLAKEHCLQYVSIFLQFKLGTFISTELFNEVTYILINLFWRALGRRGVHPSAVKIEICC